MRLLAACLVGVLFGTGIVVSGMGSPAKVVKFFDLAGTWDPSLAFVMAGALAVTVPGYRLAFRHPRPVFAPRFDLPTRGAVDARLVGGSALFGIGWGIAGFCPGGALPMLGTFEPDVVLFVAALGAGLYLGRAIDTAIITRSGGTDAIPRRPVR